MGVIDVEAFLQDLSPEAPSGDDLEYDPEFVALEQAAQGKPEQQFGDTVIPAEPPDWREVKRLGISLFTRTRDLRVGADLTRALLHLDGLPGLEDGVGLLQGLVEHCWDTVHPQLDPDDDNDPTLRVNVLASLCDPETVLSHVRVAPLVSTRGVGEFCLRDVQIATGVLEVPGGGESRLELATLDAAFSKGALEDLRTTAGSVNRVIEALRAIEVRVTEQVGAAQAVDFGALLEPLLEIQGVLVERLERRGGLAPSVEQATSDDLQAPVGEGAASVGAVTGPAGEIRTREEAIVALDRVCRYFSRHEPSSPVPLLLERAKRLVPMEFMDILRDLAPDGVAQAEVIRGAEVGAAPATEGNDDW